MKLIKSKFSRDTQMEVNRLEHRPGKKWTLPDLLDGLNEVIEEFEKLDDYSIGKATTSDFHDALAVIVDIPSVVAAPVTITLFSAINEILVRQSSPATIVIVAVHHHRLLRVATVSLEVHRTNVPVIHHVRHLDITPTVALHHHREDQIGLEDLTDHVVWTITYVFEHPLAIVLRLFAVIGQERLATPKDTRHQSIQSSTPKTILSPSINWSTIRSLCVLVRIL
ncbi:hypothetical protein TELCIR_01850 [Teladorsagia circumcincta]|uniref:Uncharacterized protein n=1 Tax=Teladorsagia circumcincta TaxID=45464 RepID=A0A2G9V2Y1_TELCI|nr:hypothetical protein TELCIR_01850 [Teladorsagia circumcincta]